MSQFHASLDSGSWVGVLGLSVLVQRTEYCEQGFEYVRGVWENATKECHSQSLTRQFKGSILG